jgi:hypothetical protein
VARFLSLDPLAADYVSWSPYNYVFSNPAILTDPTGKGPWNPIAGIGDGIASSFTSSLNKLSKNISEFADDVGDVLSDIGDFLTEEGQNAGDVYTTSDGNVTTKETETKNVKSLGQEENIEAIGAIAKAKKDDPKAFEQSKNKNIKSSLKKIGGALNASNLDGRTTKKSKPDSIYEARPELAGVDGNGTASYTGGKAYTIKYNTNGITQDTLDDTGF